MVLEMTPLASVCTMVLSTEVSDINVCMKQTSINRIYKGNKESSFHDSQTFSHTLTMKMYRSDFVEKML